VKAYVRSRLSEAAEERGSEPRTDGGADELPDFARFGPVRRESLTPVRRATAEAVAESWSRVHHVTQGDEADVTETETFRRRWKARLASGAGDGDAPPLTWTALVVKAVSVALPRFPALGSSLDLDAGERIVKEHVHDRLGPGGCRDVEVAVDTDDGLLVPVVRDVDGKDLLEVARELADLAQDARQRRLSREAMAGATFTVTNLGGLGTTTFTPVVPWPQVAILGVGRSSWRPVYGDDVSPAEGTIPTPRQVMPMSLSYDHRAVDGADAARFLRFVCEVLESPMRAWLPATRRG